MKCGGGCEVISSSAGDSLEKERRLLESEDEVGVGSGELGDVEGAEA